MKKILVIRYKKSVGDTLVISTLCNTLKEEYPNCEVHYLVYETLSALMENDPAIDKVLVLNRKEKLKGYLKTLMEIRKNNYDIVIDCRSTAITMALCFLSKGKMTISKYKKWRHLFYTHSIKGFTKRMNQVEKYHQLLQPLNITRRCTEYKVNIPQEKIDIWKDKLEKGGIDFSKLVIPMAVNSRQEYKKYPEESIGEVIKAIIEKYNCQIILTYTSNEEEYARNLATKLNLPKNIFVDFKTEDLVDLGAIFRNSDLFIGNEGGTRHVAESVSLPNLAIVSPGTNKKEWIINENKYNQCIDINDVNGTTYEDIKPSYIISRIDSMLKDFDFFHKKID